MRQRRRGRRSWRRMMPAERDRRKSGSGSRRTQRRRVLRRMLAEAEPQATGARQPRSHPTWLPQSRGRGRGKEEVEGERRHARRTN